MELKRRIESIPRKEGVSDRAVVMALGGRFTDELLSGLPAVLMPTIRATFGLSYTQVSLLGLTLNYVAAVIEPINGLLIDLWKRPWLMAWGAAGVGISTALLGVAPTLAFLLLGFAVYGLASGPLAHTADVILVEAYPRAPDRIYARATLLDTVGALLAPLSVSLAVLLGVEWRWLLISLGLSSFIYALLILKTRFPDPAHGDRQEDVGFKQALRDNLRAVFSNRLALTWLLYLFVLDIAEAPLQFNTIWLRENVGMSQALIGLYIAMEMAVSLISLIVLDRWLSRSGYRRILLVASSALLVLYPAWLLLPGIWTRFVLAIPLNLLFTAFWPIGKAQSLASVPGRGGTVTAVTSLLGLVPIPLLFGILAEVTTLPSAMLWVSLGALAMLFALGLRLPDSQNASTGSLLE